MVATDFFFSPRVFSQAGVSSTCKDEEIACENDYHKRDRRPHVKMAIFAGLKVQAGVNGHHLEKYILTVCKNMFYSIAILPVEN